jgi:hypothetical protein
VCSGPKGTQSAIPISYSLSNQCLSFPWSSSPWCLLFCCWLKTLRQPLRPPLNPQTPQYLWHPRFCFLHIYFYALTFAIGNKCTWFKKL